jgi:crossover junction endodeoxyribonuclease RusA
VIVLPTGFCCEFRVHGIPKPQPRPRATIRGRHAGVYDPGTANEWRAAVAAAGSKHQPAGPLEGPLLVGMRFYLPRPKRLMRKCDPDTRLRHTAKPDVDNLAKAVLDALTAAGWWADDSQVCSLTIEKWYTNKIGGPGCCVYVSQMQGEGC